jgi:phosphatidate cytidylyltransferase
MLKQRIITVLLLVPPLLVALFYLSSPWIAALFGVFVLAGAWEWATLCDLRGSRRIAYVGAVMAVGTAAVFFAATIPRAFLAVLVLGACWWLYALLALHRSFGAIYHSCVGRRVAGFLVLIPAWVAVTLLHATDARAPSLLVFVLVLVAFSDTGAYAAGHAFGRTKLAPTISPGKTLEGALGGLVAVLLLAYICGTLFWEYEGAALAMWLLLAGITALVAVLGDLVESKVKRVAGVKDSGTLLPGHGGVLDRIDAITAAVPVFALGWITGFGVPA